MDEQLAKFTDLYCNYQRSGNRFIDLNPLSKMNIFLVLAFSSFIVQDFRYGLFLCVFYYGLACYCKKLGYFNRVFSRLILVLGVFIIIVRQLIIPGDTVIFTLAGWRWTMEALVNGLNMAFSILGFSGAVIMFYAVTDMRDTMYALEQKGVSHSTSYILLASFQTIHDLNASAQTILESQKARGIETEGSVLTRAKAFIPVIGPLMLSAMSASEEKYIAMDARAFSAERKHTFLRELRPVPMLERMLVAAVDLGFIALCVYTVWF